MTKYDVTHISSTATDGWVSDPLNAVEGEPDGKILFLRRAGSEGNTYMSGVFTVQPSVVPSTIQLDETLLVLEGEARIDFDDGESISIVQGDMVFLPKGTKLEWHFLTPFKEMFFVAGDGPPLELDF